MRGRLSLNGHVNRVSKGSTGSARKKEYVREAGECVLRNTRMHLSVYIYISIFTYSCIFTYSYSMSGIEGNSISGARGSCSQKS